MNMAVSGRSCRRKSIFEPIIRGLKNDNFNWDQEQNPFHVGNNLALIKEAVHTCTEYIASSRTINVQLSGRCRSSSLYCRGRWNSVLYDIEPRNTTCNKPLLKVFKSSMCPISTSCMELEWETERTRQSCSSSGQLVKDMKQVPDNITFVICIFIPF